MFTQGQWIFAGISLVAFIVLIIFSYRRDSKLLKKHYSKSWLILIGFILFLALLFVLKITTR
jgi:uncharacterized membrane protein